MRELIAEINLAYTVNLIVLDDVKRFIPGGPTHGEEVDSSVIIAGGESSSIKIL
ncbi:MAG: hypothetical protein N3E39_00785 [Candidatus Methanomethylicia archaeon]|nr:hypothetical protein [Candidatus Methanomethylicia archaeon]MDW7988482.1 hypothetical protein [Nitrososphaerota archaeon]